MQAFSNIVPALGKEDLTITQNLRGKSIKYAKRKAENWLSFELSVIN